MAKTLKQIRTLDDLKPYEQTLGPRITIAREHMGIGIEDLAARMGVYPESVRAWEADERTPRANRLMMMAGILNVSITWLLEGREDERMESWHEPGLEDLRGRLELARNLIGRGLAMIESVESQLVALSEKDDEVDPSEVED